MKKLFFILFLFGCSSKEIYQDNVSQPGAEYCGPACDNLIKLNCPLGTGINEVNDKTCYYRCNEEQKEDYFWNTFCLQSIKSCDMIDHWCKSIYKK